MVVGVADLWQFKFPLAFVTFVQFVIGMVYYGPLFGKTFVSLHYKGNMPKNVSFVIALIANTVGAAIMNFVLLTLMILIHARTQGGGIVG